MLALETRSLTKAYGHRHVVSNFNMHVPKGSVYGFVRKERGRQINSHEDGRSSGSPYIRLHPSVRTGKLAKEQEILRRVGSLIEDPVLPDMSTLDNLMCKALGHSDW